MNNQSPPADRDEFSFEILCGDRFAAHAMTQEFHTASQHVKDIDAIVSEPVSELGMVEASEVLTVTIAFASGVASKVAASWIYDRLFAASKGRKIVIRHGDSEFIVRGSADIEARLSMPRRARRKL